MAYTYDQLKAKGYTDYKIHSILAEQKSEPVASGGGSSLYTKQSTTTAPAQKETFNSPVSGNTITRNSDMSDKEWEAYQSRLSGVDYVTGKPVGERQQTILDLQKKQYSGEMSYDEALNYRKNRLLTSLKNNENVSKEYVDLFERKWNPKTGKIEGATEEEWAAIPDRFAYMRDTAGEQAMANKLGVDAKGNEADLYMASYAPEQLNTLISTGQVDPNLFTAQQLQELGFDAGKLQTLVEAGYLRPEMLANMQQLGGQLSVAQSNLAATPAPNDTAMNVLAEALNMKSNYKNQNIGVSDLFSQAGLSGYEVLAQSLSQRSREMGNKIQSAQELVATTGGAMAETYSSLASHAESLQKDFDTQMERLLEIDKQYREDEKWMTELQAGMEHDVNMEMLKHELKIAEMEAEKLINPATGVNSDIYSADGNIGIVDPATGETRPLSQGETKVGGQVYKKSVIEDIFNVGGLASWCGVFASTLSTGPKVGNTWAEKKTKITHRENPTAGQKLLVPLGVQTDNEDYGHVATVLDYNPENGNIWVVESNRDGRMNRGAEQGVVTFGVYNINELNKKYGSNWGFTQGEFKDNIKAALKDAGPLPVGQFMKGVGELATGNPLGGLRDMIGGSMSIFGAALGTPEQQSLAYRYVMATGDEAAYDEKSQTYRALSNMQPEELERYVEQLESEKEAKTQENNEEFAIF